MLAVLLVVGSGLTAIYFINADFGEAPVEASTGGRTAAPKPAIVDGIDTESGLVAEGDYLIVKGSCLSCHSGKLITQNRMSRDSWLTTIRWMQETQNLGPLYDNEDKILDYLEKYYSPKKKGRRARLANIDWYELK